MEFWTIKEWIEASCILLVIIFSLMKIVLGRINENNKQDIRVLLIMIDEDRKELYQLELSGRDVPLEIKQELDILKENALSLYRINKKTGNSIKVQRLIECYFKQLVDIEGKVGGFVFMKKGPI